MGHVPLTVSVVMPEWEVGSSAARTTYVAPFHIGHLIYLLSKEGDIDECIMYYKYGSVKLPVIAYSSAILKSRFFSGCKGSGLL
jgi:hypothetical protein